MSVFTTNFRRLTNPVFVQIGNGEAVSTDVPDNFIPANAESFYVVNSSPCWVRLRGFKNGQAGEVTAETGWLFPPGHVGVYSTQKPERMSAMAVERPGFPVSAEVLVPLEISYGYGL
jgi:hypothetical protein